MFSAPWSKEDVERFMKGYFYSPDVFYVSEVLEADPKLGMLQAVVKENTPWVMTPHQRGDEDYHPRHINGSDLLMLTASLGAMHAYFFHDCKWEDGWVGFGNRIENAEFRSLASVDKPLVLRSTETRSRRGNERMLIELAFEFSQDGKLVYTSKQMAMFLKR